MKTGAKLLQLLSEGKITHSDLDDVDIKLPLWDAARLCHTFFCSGQHNDTCNFMLDDILSDTWEMESHKEWINKTIRLMNKLGIQEPDEMIRTLNDATMAANTQGPDITLVMSLITFPQMLDSFIGKIEEAEPSLPVDEQESEPEK